MLVPDRTRSLTSAGYINVGYINECSGKGRGIRPSRLRTFFFRQFLVFVP